MKKLVIVLSFFFASQFFAQQFEGVVHLKNGSTVQGTIIEIVPNEKVKIRTKDNDIIIYQMEEVVKITKSTNLQNQYKPKVNSSPTSYSQDSYSQQSEDIVYLKDGRVIKGKIVNEVPNTSIDIKKNDGNTYFYRMDQISKITKAKEQSYISETSPQYGRTNYSGITDYSSKFSTPNLSFKKGDRIGSFKIGVKNTNAGKGAFLLAIEFGISNNILGMPNLPTSLGIGASIGFSSGIETIARGYYGDYEYSITNFLVGANIYLHFNVINNNDFDTYIMGALDYSSLSSEYKYNNDYYYENDYTFNEKDLGSSFSPNIYVGIRYFPTPKYALSFELGTGMGTFRFGLEGRF